MTLSGRSLYRHQPLNDQTYQVLRSAILSGELTTGERLVETQLAGKLQVSRTPIREAMRQLQREGLIAADRSGGLRVTQISLADAMQLYDCRLALEQLAVVGACQNATQKQLQNLERVLTQEEMAINQHSAEYSSRLLEINSEFHRCLAESSGNSWLVSLLDQVSDKLILLRVQTLRSYEDARAIHAEHQQVYQAIAQRDPQAAAAAINQHLLVSKERVRRVMPKLEPNQES